MWRSVLRGTLTFYAVFVAQFFIRGRFNWPPNSWVELALSEPLTFFILWYRTPTIWSYLAEGLLGWGTVGALFGLTLGFSSRFRALSPPARTAVLVLCACLILILSRVFLPTPEMFMSRYARA
jgi:hypothetical protein